MASIYVFVITLIAALYFSVSLVSKFPNRYKHPGMSLTALFWAVSVGLLVTNILLNLNLI